MKIKAFSILELIISISIMSIILTYSIIVLNKNIQINKKEHERELKKLDILSFKIFLIKKIEVSKNIKVFNNKLLLGKNLLYLNKRNIYFNKNILIKNITTFSVKKDAYLRVNLCSKTICQKIVLKL